MKKRFVICINATITVEQNRTFIYFLNSKGVAWWHWLSGTWLVDDPLGTLNSETIRDIAQSIFPGIYNLVLEFREDGTDGWHGYGPAKEPKSMFPWIRENWHR